MLGLPPSLIQRAQEAISAELYRLGHTPKSLEETQRDVLWWTYARAQAALNLRPLSAGWGIAFTSAGYAELVPVEVPQAGRDRVTIRTLFSSVSPGTERAQYLRLPNARLGVLGRPGYSAAGIVASVGPRVRGLRPGDPVAATGAPHASLVNLPQHQVFKIPAGVPPEHAALIMLGTICLHGADLAAVRPGERVVAVGAGPIGALAFRIACRSGTPAGIVAASRRRADVAASSGAPLLVAGEDTEEIQRLSADVVIEATGDPQGIRAAIDAAGAGARILLLGSARGMTRDLPLERIRSGALTLVGAHVDTLDLGPSTPETPPRREVGERFLRLLAEDQLPVADLVGPAVDPRRAAAFYRELAEGRHRGGAYFDFSLLSPGEALHRSHLLRLPNMTGRGMEAIRPLRPPRRQDAGVLALADPFAGAHGRLRIGLVGCGDIAVHNAAGAAAAPNVELVACFDPVLPLAEELAGRHGASAYSSFEELLDSADIDAVVLSVPHHLHAPLAVEAARAGKNVIVEKPLARDLEGAIYMAHAAEQAGVWLSPCFPQRYGAHVQIARGLIERGAVGEARGTLTRLFLDKSPAYWLGGFSGRAHSDWRRSRELAGGGVLIMNLSHHLDLMRYLTGLEAEQVAASMEPPDEVEDVLIANLRYSGGALGLVIGASSVRGSTEEEMSIWGSEGRIVVEPRPRVYTLRALDGLRTTRWQSFGRLPTVPIRAVYFSRLATAVSEGREPEVSTRDGLAVQAMIEAIYLAAQRGEPVAVGELLSAAQRERVAA